MPDWLIVVLVVAAVLIVGALAFGAMRKNREKQVVQRREQAEEHRQGAVGAAREAGEKDLAARRAAEEAERAREQSQELEQKAAETDPDTPKR
ncbi:MAG: hypothetical protein M3391_00960 [Actinomycetota bacterium]|nr:hypothetical protein [Actinomycetota bacterium]